VHLINFGDEFVKGHLISKTTAVLKQVKDNLKNLGSPTDIDAKIEAVRVTKRITDAKKQEQAEKEAKKGLFSDSAFTEKVNGQKDANGEPVPMDFKTPEVPLEALDQKALYRLMRQKHLPISGHMTNAEMVVKLKAEAAQQAERDNQAAAKKAMAENKPTPDLKGPKLTSNAALTVNPDKPGLTQEAMPYLQGIQMNMVNPNHRWIIAANEADMPLKAGISGTTHRFLGLGELLGVDDKPGMRLAMLGHLRQ
jgi:hypothetical protein